MKRTVCGGCGYDDLRLILDLGLSPVADAYTSTADEVSETYPLQLAVCTGCWLVQLLEVVDHETLFGTGYSFYSSASAPLSRYHETYARDTLTRYGNLAKGLTVEVGCNDGDLLRHFQSAGCRAVGVDPSGGPVEVARTRGIDVWNVPFGRDVADSMRAELGPAGLIIANHVLAHVEDVSDTLSGVAALLDVDGVALVEVQYLPDLLVGNGLDLVYHEHRNFFTLSSLEKAAQRHGLYVRDVLLTSRQYGSLRVTLSRSRFETSAVTTLRESERWLSSLGSYAGVQGRADRIRSRLRGAVLDELEAGRTVVGYGAPAKATTLLNFCKFDSEHISRVVDSTPAKQGRFIPGTGIPVVPDGPGALAGAHTVLLLAHNYAGAIMGNNWRFSVERGGRWLLPLPAPTLL